MVSEDKYKEALAIVKQYKDEQLELLGKVSDKKSKE